MLEIYSRVGTSESTVLMLQYSMSVLCYSLLEKGNHDCIFWLPSFAYLKIISASRSLYSAAIPSRTWLTSVIHSGVMHSSM